MQDDCPGDEAASSGSVYFKDADGDGWGDPAQATLSCEPVEGYVQRVPDCDDSDPTIAELGLRFPDADGDGYGDANASANAVIACGGAGLADNALDCDDGAPTVYPGAPTVCGDGVDNDCRDASECPLPEGELNSWELSGHHDGAGSQKLGTTVAWVGDLNGDGYADAASSAPGNDAASGVAGAVYIYYGDRDGGALAHGGFDAVLVSGSLEDETGAALAGAGDLDLDGFDDLLIGSPGRGEGTLNVVLGPVPWERMSLPEGGRTITLGVVGPSWSSRMRFGNIATSLGDPSDDDWPDLAVGASDYSSLRHSNIGAVYMLPGPISEDQYFTSEVSLITGSSDNSFFGMGLTAMDLNGDGEREMVVGAPKQHNPDDMETGALYVFTYNAPIGETVDAAEFADLIIVGSDPKLTSRLGATLAPGGDLDGDGYEELLVGAPTQPSGSSDSQSCALILSGDLLDEIGLQEDKVRYADELLLASVSAPDQATTKDSTIGETLSAVPDLNGDSLPELAVGDSGYGENRGAVLLFESPVQGSLTPDDAFLSVYGDTSSGQFGLSVSSSGDSNALGVPDLLIGEARDTQPGSTYLLLLDGI